MKKTAGLLIWFAVALVASVSAISCSDDDDNTVIYEADIVSMLFNDERVVTQPAVVDGNDELTFVVSSESENMTFTPEIEVSEGAAVSPASGSAQNFSTGEVTYTVTAADGQTRTYTVRCVRLQSTDARVEGMTLSGGSGAVEGDIAYKGTDIYFYVNYHSTAEQLKSIKLSFTLASEKAAISPVEGKDPDFSVVESAKYKVTAENEAVHVVYTVHKVTLPNTDAMITSFTLAGDSETDPILTAQPALDPADQTLYFFTVKYKATDEQIDALIPEITVSEGATYAIKEGGNESFSQGVVTYIVTAQDGETSTEYRAEYRRDRNDEARILSVNTEGTIVANPIVDETAKKVTLHAASTITDEQIKAYRPDFVLSDNATARTENTNETDYDYLGAGVKFVVTSEDGSTSQTYTVIIDREARNSARITAFALTGDQAAWLSGTVAINENEGGNGTITFALSYKAPKNKVELAPAITHSAGSTMAPASGESVEFTYGTPVTYTVTAEDNITTKQYDVTVTRQQNTEALIKEITFSDNGTADDPNTVAVEFSGTGNRYATVYVRESLTAGELAALRFSFTLSDEAVVSPDPASIAPATGYEYQFTVTAEDGTTKNTYTVKPMKRRIYNFDEWDEIISGKYTYYHPSYKWNSDNATTDWCSANVGRVLLASNYYEDYFPTDKSSDSYAGAYAARLTTHKTKGSILYPYLVPGSMFTGTFITNIFNTLNSTKFGIEFHGKPIKITGKYKYTPGETFWDGGKTENPAKTDGPAMTAVFFEVDSFDPESVNHGNSSKHNTNNYLDGKNLTSSDRIVAKIQKRDYPASAEYVDFELVPEYGQNGRTYDPEKLYKLAIVFSSSKDGDGFNGAHISELLIDDVTIYYE